MNEKLDLTKILKDCPEGTKLYSTVHGEVYFSYIGGNSNYPIKVTNSVGNIITFTDNGRYNINYIDGECILFPSKDNRDWSTFKVPQKEFKKGDFVYRELNNQQKWVSIHNIVNKHNEIISYVNCSFEYNFLFYVKSSVILFTKQTEVKYERLATEEEKRKLLKALDEQGYIWDAEKLELRKKEHKFKPFEKVLIRQFNHEEWCISHFSHIDSENIIRCEGGSRWIQCIPYEGNEHLLGTTNNPE